MPKPKKQSSKKKGKSMAKRRGGKHVGSPGGLVQLGFVTALDDGGGHILWSADTTSIDGYSDYFTRGYLKINPSAEWVQDVEVESGGLSSDGGVTPWTTGVTTGQAKVEVRDRNGELIATSGVFDVTT